MLWPLVVFVLFVQEIASTDAVLLLARQSGLNIWIIHLIWLTASTIDIGLGYFIGKNIKDKSAGSKLGQWAQRAEKKLEARVGKRGLGISLALFGIFDFPYVNAFIAAWLPEMTFASAFGWTIIGDFLWYSFAWASTLGIIALTRNSEVLVVVVALIGVAVTIAFSIWSRQRKTRSS